MTLRRSFVLGLLSPVFGAVSILGFSGTAMCQSDLGSTDLRSQETQWHSQTAPSSARIVPHNNGYNSTQSLRKGATPAERMPQNDRSFQRLTSPTSPRPVLNHPSSVRIASVPEQDGQTVQVPSRTSAESTIQQVAHSSPLQPPLASRTYVLRNCDWRQFEINMLEMWMQEPEVQSLKDGEIMRVTIPVRDSNTANTMLINRGESSLYFEGSDNKVEEWQNAMQLLDRVETERDTDSVRLISTVGVTEEEFRTVSYLIRNRQQQDDNETMGAIQLPPQEGSQEEPSGGPVKARVMSDLDLLILTGDADDVKALQDRINTFIEEAKRSVAITETISLQNADPTQTAEIVQGIFDAQYAQNLGVANINPIPNPRGLLVTGKASAIETVKAIVSQYDQQSQELPPATAGFKRYSPRYISAVDAKQRVDEYFNQAPNQGTGSPGDPENVLTIADVRSNTLLVKASPSYLQQIDLLMKELDVVGSGSTAEIRVFKLKNTEAVTLQPILQFALNGNVPNAPQGFAPTTTGAIAQLPVPNQVGAQPNVSQQASRMLQMMTVDRSGKQVRSGILFDVTITADQTSNSLIVTGPAESMDLIEALIQRLDVLPDVETQIKVFQVINGDASALINMLDTLFTNGQANLGAQGGTGTLPLQSATATEGQSLANLRFTLDERTNSIIASGPVGDLEVVRSLLIRLDEEDINRRQVTVYRLNNAFSNDVADAVNDWLNERTALVSDNFDSPFVANQREVIVVPETVTNTLIVSALPEYFDEVIEVIDRLDRRPPMVKVEVLIAEVSLNALEEFGAEIGVQDSLLFGRGQSIADTLDSNLLTTGETFAGAAQANFGVGTINPDVGFGGLVLSAGNESVNLVLRALKDRNCLRVLSRPQLMTVENLQGRVAVVSNVPRVTGTTITNFGVQNNIADVLVGVTLEVTPRVSPDGMIVMFVNAINSQLGASGVVVATDANGNPIESPIINETQAQTTVMARSGQTVVLSGLIQESKGESQRGAPILSNLPIVGPLFGFESDTANRTELLIILKPFIVNDGDDSVRQQNNEEFDRMNWCMCDVAELFGSTNYDDTASSYAAPMTVYPDADPAGLNPHYSQAYPQSQYGHPVEQAPAYPVQPGYPAQPQPGYGQPVPVQQAPPMDFETGGMQFPQSNGNERKGLLRKFREATNTPPERNQPAINRSTP